MLGLVAYREPGEKNGPRTLAGVRFCAAYVERGGGLRAALSARRAAKYLKKHRVRQAVFPPDFPMKEVFARRGVLPPDERALRGQMAAEIIRRAMTQLGLPPERTRLALAAARPSAALNAAALTLAREVRYLTLCSPDTERLSCIMRWDWGVSVCAAAAGTALCADLAVVFDGLAPLCRCPVLPLGDETLAVVYGAPTLAEETARWDGQQLICALFAAGALKTGEICIARVEFSAQTGQNTKFP